MPTPEAQMFARDALADDPGELDEDWLADQLDRFAAQRGGWRPIETAPKDGEPFLGAIYWADSGEWEGLRMSWRDDISKFVDATYSPFGADQERPSLWMPIPAPQGAPHTGGGDAPDEIALDYSAMSRLANSATEGLDGALLIKTGGGDSAYQERYAAAGEEARRVIREAGVTVDPRIAGGGDAGERARAIADIFGMTEADRHPDDMEKVADIIRDSRREGAEVMREALREPTKAMVEAGADRHRDDDCQDDEELAREMWRAMYAKVALPIPGSKTDAG